MAKSAHEAKILFPQAVVVTRFLGIFSLFTNKSLASSKGTSIHTSNGRAMLHNITTQIIRAYLKMLFHVCEGL